MTSTNDGFNAAILLSYATAYGYDVTACNLSFMRYFSYIHIYIKSTSPAHYGVTHKTIKQANTI